VPDLAAPARAAQAVGPLAPLGAALPDFPWDLLEPYKERARAHPDGIVDLSIGTPVDPTPDVVQAALRASADAPGYPTTIGTPALRAAVAGWLERRFGVTGVDPATCVLPTVGSKELVALLPTLLGAPRGSRVLHPALAYPTYDVGARLAGAVPEPYTDLAGVDPSGVSLLWLNSPSNPTGAVMSPDELRGAVEWARRNGVVVVSDECYLELGWDTEPRSVLHPDVCGGSFDGLLTVHSLSKRSNLAGYRAGFVVGDPALVGALLEVRKHAGLIVPAPVQAAATAALQDDAHVDAQRARYVDRRARLRPALEGAGFRIDASAAGLYLWASDGSDCWDAVGRLAELGILVAPGAFYGANGARHVRAALTATDERVTAAVQRLAA
jgi:succinyldiaminopimelate transaminase